MKIHKLVVGSLGTNCYIVSSRKGNAFVIDPGDEASKIKKFISKEKLNVRFVVNTHGHIDHIKSDSELGFPVYVHKEDADMVSDPQKNHMVSFFGSFKPVVPERLLVEGDILELDELKFEVIHTPGHTQGGICLFGQGVLFSGDTLFKNGVGRTDLPESSYGLLERSLRKISKLGSGTIVYPGHGGETTIGVEFGSA